MGLKCAAVVAALTAAPAQAAPANTLQALGHALTACFHAPEGSTGSQITVILSLRRDGALLGRPRITFSHLIGPEELRQRFVAEALGSLAACTPVAVTPGLGGAIAGRPFSIHFIGGPAAQAI